MTRHRLETTHENRPVHIVIGWDRHLQGYFMFIERVDVEDPGADDEDLYLYSNLVRAEESHPRNLDPFLDVLKGLSLGLPAELVQELAHEKNANTGNKLVHWTKQGEKVTRNQVF